jgi:RNA polymerase sigma factor (sigma-70 family)
VKPQLTLPRTGHAREPLADIINREQARLLRFIRRRVADPGDAEDVLQDVFSALVEANRLLMPIDHVTGWLFRVARNRITDLFRRRAPALFAEMNTTEVNDDAVSFGDLLPSPDVGPEALYLRRMLIAELEAALEDLPREQRDVFIAHEIEGKSFKEMAAETGVAINTLLSRKRYAVLRLRARLQRLHDEMTRT